MQTRSGDALQLDKLDVELHRRKCFWAAVAALAASFGDLLMLSVVHEAPWLPNVASFNKLVVVIGALLGMVLIPLYFLGYAAAGVLLEPLQQPARKIYLTAGAMTAGLGAIAHGLNGEYIYRALASGEPPLSPTDAIAPAWSPFFVIGSVAVMSAMFTSMAYCWIAWRLRRVQARLPAILNPIASAFALVLLGSPSQDVLEYVAFVAPNLGHCMFFLACGRSITGWAVLLGSKHT